MDKSMDKNDVIRKSFIIKMAFAFDKCSDEIFWADRERVSALISLYHENECLWNILGLGLGLAGSPASRHIA
jgi:hypothetical protein